MRTSGFTSVVRTGATLALITLALTGGCSKKKPPAPPPLPPPPPAAPPPVSFDSIKQELKADARLAFADSISVTDETFARAAVAFGDALVKGDAAKLKGYLGQRSQETLGALQDHDQWPGVTKNVEGLRFIVAQPPPTDMAIEKGYPDMDPALREATDIVNTWKKTDTLNMSPDDRLLNSAKLEKALREYAKKLKETGRESEFRQIDQYVIRLLNMPVLKPANIFNSSATMTLLMAVQEPGSSFLLGWQAYKDGDNWKFEAASTSDGTKPRTTDWDAVGVNGFALVDTVDTLLGADGTLPPAPKPEGKEKDKEAPKTAPAGGRPSGG